MLVGPWLGNSGVERANLVRSLVKPRGRGERAPAWPIWWRASKAGRP